MATDEQRLKPPDFQWQSYQTTAGRLVSPDGMYWWDSTRWLATDRHRVRPRELAVALAAGLGGVLAPWLVCALLAGWWGADYLAGLFDTQYFVAMAFTTAPFVLGALAIPVIATIWPFAWRIQSRRRLLFEIVIALAAAGTFAWLPVIVVTLGVADGCTARNPGYDLGPCEAMNASVGGELLAMLVCGVLALVAWRIGRRRPRPA